MEMVPRDATLDADTTEVVNVRRRQARSIESRARILKSAITEFASKGFDGASTRLIAERAGIRHALLIYHFQTKRGIWEAVMNDVILSYRQSFRRQLEGFGDVDDVTKLQVLHADFIQMSASRPELHWLMSHEAREASERMEWIAANLLDGNFSTVTGLIRSAQATGHYVLGDPLHLHYTFLGAAARIFMLSEEVRMTTGRSPFDQAFIEEHIRVCRSLFFRENSASGRAPN